MNTKEILKNIPNKEGSGYFTVFIPSLEKDIRIRHLSVADQKVISKLSIDESPTTFASESDLAKLAVAETNAIDPVSLDNLDVRDFFILCCALRKENYMDSFTVKYGCKACDHEFEEAIDFDVLIENAKEFEIEDKEEIIGTKKVGDIKVKLGIPSQMDLIMLEMYYAEVAKTREISMAEKYIDYVICCIKELSVLKDEKYVAADDFPEMHYLEKVAFIQSLGANIEQIAKLFNEIGLVTSEFFYDMKCPNCSTDVKTFMDISDFFML